MIRSQRFRKSLRSDCSSLEKGEAAASEFKWELNYGNIAVPGLAKPSGQQRMNLPEFLYDGRGIGPERGSHKQFKANAARLFPALTVLNGNHPNDEGLMLVAADRIAHGQVPYSDFWWFYPPGQPYLLAALICRLRPRLEIDRFLGA